MSPRGLSPKGQAEQKLKPLKNNNFRSWRVYADFVLRDFVDMTLSSETWGLPGLCLPRLFGLNLSNSILPVKYYPVIRLSHSSVFSDDPLIALVLLAYWYTKNIFARKETKAKEMFYFSSWKEIIRFPISNVDFIDELDAFKQSI